MKKRNTETPGQEEQGHLWKNIGKIVFLLASLAAAWFVLDRLING